MLYFYFNIATQPTTTNHTPPHTLSFTFKGSIGHAFTVCIHTENQNQGSFYPFILREISVLAELPLGHLCYLLKGIPPQSNSPPEAVMGWGSALIAFNSFKVNIYIVFTSPFNPLSKTSSRVVVFHFCYL